MSKIKANDGGPQGDLEDVHLTLTMALLYALNASVINKVRYVTQARFRPEQILLSGYRSKIAQ